jgi:mycoredoxin
MAASIQLYGANWCRLTCGLQACLTSARWPYDYYNVERDPAADEFVRTMNGGKRHFPIVVFEGHILTNPTPSQLEQMIDDHRRRRGSVLGNGPRLRQQDLLAFARD